jgi:hypothetical protein
MVSLPNNEDIRTAVGSASWFDRLTIKRSFSHRR